MLRLVTVVGLLGGVSAAIAEPVRMTSEDIRRAMPGALLEIDTPLRIAIPVKVGTDGLMSAEAGALGLTLGATKDRGRWWTEDDKLCMKWFRWFDAKKRCMVLHRDGNRVQWAEGSGENGTATITEAAPVVVAAAPRPLKKDRVETATDSTPKPVDAISVDAAVADEMSVAPVPAKPFATAGLGNVFLPVPKEEEPSMLGMSGEPGSEPEASLPIDVPAPRAELTAPTRKPRPAKDAAAASSAPPASKSARRTPPTPSTPALTSFRVTGVSYGDTLNVRSGPSEYHAAIGTIPASARGVHIVGQCRDQWCPIRHGRLKGWVNRYYLAEDDGLRASVGR